MGQEEQTVFRLKNVVFVLFMIIWIGFRMLAMRLDYWPSGFANLYIVNSWFWVWDHSKSRECYNLGRLNSMVWIDRQGLGRWLDTILLNFYHCYLSGEWLLILILYVSNQTWTIYTLRVIIKRNKLLMRGIGRNCYANYMNFRENWQN